MATVPANQLYRDATEPSKVQPLQHPSIYFLYSQYEVAKFRKVVALSGFSKGILADVLFTFWLRPCPPISG